MTAGQIYLDGKDRVSALARSLTEDELATTTPSCPEWTAKDVVSHLVGGAKDFVAGTADGSPEWTARHVREGKGRSLDELFAEWDGVIGELVPLIDGNAGLFVVPLDLVTHEQDVRNAVGKPGVRDNDGIDWGLQKVMSVLGGKLKQEGAPALRITAGDDEFLLGGGGEPVEVDVDRYELFRAALGRRSESQVRDWAWKGDPTPFLGGLSVFGLAARDVRE